MRNTLPSSDVVIGLTILISTICSVMCLENESGPQDMNHESLVPALSDRYFRNYYEMYRDLGEPVWKRAPAAGFFGMRGKKVPASSFYGMRGKKGPSGFLGMRGKKQDPSLQGIMTSVNSSPVDLMGTGWASNMKMKGPSSMDRLDGLDDYTLFGITGPSSAGLVPLKRAPVDGFMGLRGKRSTPWVRGQPANSYE